MLLYKNLCLYIILILIKPYCWYAQGIIEHSTPSTDEMMFIHHHYDKMDADSYEDKILRARAYVNVLSMSSDNHYPHYHHYNNKESSQYMYGPIEPFNQHNNVRFEWMHPFELYECNIE
ncbi:hypothetical protein BLA29_005877 [Euroglyphus maynei]|uniref:Uncharacterized protein n=1 Tax=Euroglyphus maynei TaxID=6958 RepID=A0A1Y3BB73_EURMA|nr:hypothetical protein BLA29_005877 [Euroglyphus maynei]